MNHQPLRYDVFNNIHKALRSMLFSIQLKMQQTDFNTPDAGKVIADLEGVLACYDEHADVEDEYILAHVTALEPQIAAALEDDHVTDHELSSHLCDLITAWKATGNAETAKAIFYALNEFIAFNLYHMNKEEKVLLPLLWKHYSDAEILDMEHRIVAAVDPQVLMEESRWMMRSISDNEIKGWLGGMKQGAPPQVYNAFVQMAEEELPAARFRGLGLELINIEEMELSC